MEGGYDYQFVDPGPTDDQKCPICHLVVRDAHQVTCCGKLLCKCCLMKNQRRSNNCPMCRQITGNRYFEDIKSDREIKSLRVYCSYKDAGCKWIGELRGVEEHMKDCNYKIVECPDCKDTMLNLILDKHRSDECRMREYKCPLCKKEGTYQLITTAGHKNTCPEVILECQNAGCNELVKRCKLSSHTEVCSKQVINCPFHHMGCKFKSERENLMAHIEKTTASHIDIVVQQMQMYNRLTPIGIKFSNFTSSKEKNEKIFSEGFYTGIGGYKVRLGMYPNGAGDGKSTHLSMFINLMPGANDDTLEFPLRGTFTMTILNQLEDDNHHTESVDFDNTFGECSCRRWKLDVHGWGRPKFLPHFFLGLNQDCNTKYLHDDTVYFRVTAKIFSATKPWLAVM